MLLTIPQEIQEAIVVICALIRPSSIAALAKTCQALRSVIGIPADHHLWRSIFLAVFDDPRPALVVQSGVSYDECGATFDWQREAQRRFRAAIRMDRAAMAEMAEFKQIVDEGAVEALWDTAILSLPAESQFTSEPDSKNEIWLENCLRAAILPKAKTQHLAKLHLLASFAHVRTSVSLPAATSISSGCRLRSRAYAYDMRNYNPDTLWGPWAPKVDGEVNWEHLWHLVNIVRHNAYQRGSSDLPLSGLDSLRAHSIPRSPDDPDVETEWNDWAGVQGVWFRAVSFMDYRDLHEYNSSSPNEDGTLPTRTFENLQFDEAFRLIKGYFSVVKVEAHGPPKYPHRPTIHFVGDASLPNYPQDTMVHRITKGTVSVTEYGHIRWSFVTRVGGHRWSSEGVQIGGPKSRAGVVGVWSSADHDLGDPAGPFWLWRSGEGRDALKSKSAHVHYHLVVNLANQ